jgi:hypothetical protein
MCCYMIYPAIQVVILIFGFGLGWGARNIVWDDENYQLRFGSCLELLKIHLCDKWHVQEVF